MAHKRARQPATRKSAATTTDVLGKPLEPEKVSAKWRKHYRRLLKLREHLLRRQDNLVQDAVEERPAFSQHIADAATDSYDRDFALSRISSEQDALYEIDEALNRIRSGTYGKCEVTGKPIEPERLLAVPWTRFSAAAERQLEKDGAVSRARFNGRQAAVGRVSPVTAPAADKEAAVEEE